MSMTVGVVGLGNMGAPMAQTLTAKGFAVIGTDLAPERRRAAAKTIRVTDSAGELFGDCEVALMSLPSSREVEAVVLGPGGFVEKARPGALLIDTSTADPTSTRRIAASLAARGFEMLDAPVSGGATGAAQGQLTIMVGGGEAALARGRPVLDALAKKVVHVGGPGAGNVAKLVNNLLCAAHLLTTAEAVKLAVTAGVDPARLLEAVNTASGRSGVSEINFPRWVLSGSLDSGFTMGLMRKDVGLALDLAETLGLRLTLGRAVGELWSGGVADLADAEDFNRIAEAVMRSETGSKAG